MEEHELSLWKRFKSGDKDVLKELLARHMSLVLFWANKMCLIVPSADREHLITEGREGLKQAAERFDLSKGTEFRTYAQHIVCGKILKSPEVELDITGYQKDRYRQIDKARNEWIKQTGEEPTDEQIAEKLNLTVTQVLNAIDAWNIAVPKYSIDSIEPGIPLFDPAEAADQQADLLLKEALFKLEKPEYEVIGYYYWDNLSTKEIASRLGMSEANVKRIRIVARNKIYKHFGIDPGGKK